MSTAADPGPAPVTGGCLCGRVRYEFRAAPLAQSLCHCRSCRRACGASPVAWLVLPTAGLRFVAGRPSRHRSSPGVERGFCRACGTPLTYRVLADPDTIDLTLCSLDEPARFAPTREVWVEHRLSWAAPAAGRPRFARGSADGPPLDG